ncbi:MAG: DUF2961 domain-containing protein [Gammaproteobacteria bacterium]|nr:DUF2961 domain-containing protein [Gammaproteobacteria bacterium]
MNDGLGLAALARLSEAESRAISAENPDGAVGGGGRATEGTGALHARELGRGFKVSPSIEIPGGGTAELARIDGAGAIEQIWLTGHGTPLRNLILRMVWDGQAHPSVEAPLGDFFANGWGTYAQVASLPVCVNPARGLNCYWPMPFRTSAAITLENRDERNAVIYYQINYALSTVPADCAYFHAQFRRTNPVPERADHVILDGVTGCGHYVGTYLAWAANHNGWWGEGEVKFFIDGDSAYPTICGTGTEDYVGGSHNFDLHTLEAERAVRYRTYTTPHSGLVQAIPPDDTYRAGQRFGLYRWHLTDPVRFRERLKVTVQSLGWRPDPDPARRRYLPRRDDIASTAYWYQTLPSAPPPPLSGRDDLEIT